MSKSNILNKRYNSPYYIDSELEDIKPMKSGILRQNNELFDDEDNVVHKIIRVRRKKTSSKGEYWEILENDKVVLELKGYRFSNKEKQFLRMPEGIKAIMKLYQEGNYSVSKIKKGIEPEIK